MEHPVANIKGNFADGSVQLLHFCNMLHLSLHLAIPTYLLTGTMPKYAVRCLDGY